MDGAWFKLGWPVGINSWKALFEIQALLNAMWKVMQVLLCLVAVVSAEGSLLILICKRMLNHGYLRCKFVNVPPLQRSDSCNLPGGDCPDTAYPPAYGDLAYARRYSFTDPPRVKRFWEAFWLKVLYFDSNHIHQRLKFFCSPAPKYPKSLELDELCVFCLGCSLSRDPVSPGISIARTIVNHFGWAILSNHGGAALVQ